MLSHPRDQITKLLPPSTCQTGNGPAAFITHPPIWMSTDLRDGKPVL